MIQKGNWSGTYTFSKPKYNRIRGFEHTKFSFVVEGVEGNSFTGSVQDDLSTGGTEGVGVIEGKILGDQIMFVKKMPVMTLLMDQKGTKRTLPKKHRPIYYSGKFSSDGKSAKGSWTFQFGFVWLGIIPIPMFPLNGTWVMERVEMGMITNLVGVEGNFQEESFADFKACYTGFGNTFYEAIKQKHPHVFNRLKFYKTETTWEDSFALYDDGERSFEIELDPLLEQIILWDQSGHVFEIDCWNPDPEAEALKYIETNFL